MKRLAPIVVALFLLAPAALYAQPEAPAPEVPAEVATPEAAPETPAPAASSDSEITGADVEGDGSSEAEAPPEDPVELATQIYSKIKDGKWLPAVALILVLLIWGVQKLAAWKIEWFDSKLGKYAIAFGTAAASSVAMALWAGEGLSVGIFTAAIGAALAASGGFEALSDLFGKKGSDSEA
jgi:hypothetical protein